MPHGSEREGRFRPLKICPATYGTQCSAASVPATWWVEEDSETGADTVLDAQAFKDRRRLRQAVSMLISSRLADYAPDKRHFTGSLMSSTSDTARLCIAMSWDTVDPVRGFAPTVTQAHEHS